MNTQTVGTIIPSVAAAIGDVRLAGSPIMLGKSNIEHMMSSHPEDYAIYGSDIPMILSSPDYVRRNEKDGSIEYVKEYFTNERYVKVAVRVSLGGTYFARSLYTLNANRVRNYIANGNLTKID